MTDAHNPRVLTDADAAADLAGLPRPVSTDEVLAWAETSEIYGGLATSHMLRALVSERDALAVRVRELTDDRDSWRDQCSQRVADWAAEHERVRELEAERDAAVNCLKWLKAHLGRFDPPASPNYLVGQIDAAINASKEQP